jgi:nucleoside-diphosphate-sugar epimerase
MNKTNLIACITGASGVIGSKIAKRLLLLGYKVRALDIRKCLEDPNIEFYQSKIENEKCVDDFLKNAHFLFHCAAELKDQSKMWEVNVSGTERLLEKSREAKIRYLCYISSAGVIGKTNLKWVDETSPCHPQTLYEQSKWAAEKLVAQGIEGCRVVILRPTNVIDDERPGALALPMRNSWRDRLNVLVKGGECAHIIHAEDIAAAAVYFISYPKETPQCFFVSCDNDQMNTFAGIWTLFRAVQAKSPDEGLRPSLHLPIFVPHLLRRLWGRSSNRGDVRYSSQRILSAGFTYPLGFRGAVKQVVSKQEAR